MFAVLLGRLVWVDPDANAVHTGPKVGFHFLLLIADFNLFIVCGALRLHVAVEEHRAQKFHKVVNDQVLHLSKLEPGQQRLRVLVHEGPEQLVLDLGGCKLYLVNEKTVLFQNLSQELPLAIPARHLSPQLSEVLLGRTARHHAKETKQINRLWLCAPDVLDTGIHRNFQGVDWVEFMRVSDKVFTLHHSKHLLVQLAQRAIL